MPEYISTIKVKDAKRVKQMFPSTYSKYIIKTVKYKSEPLLCTTVGEIRKILDALKIDYEVIEVPITMHYNVLVAGHECDINGNQILVRTYDDKGRHKKRVERVTKELAKHDLLEDVVCKVRLITEKIC